MITFCHTAGFFFLSVEGNKLNQNLIDFIRKFPVKHFHSKVTQISNQNWLLSKKKNSFKTNEKSYISILN